MLTSVIESEAHPTARDQKLVTFSNKSIATIEWNIVVLLAVGTTNIANI
jgi:hypothetical protein